MNQDDLALMAAILAGAILVAAFTGWRQRNSRADVALMGTLGAALATGAGLLAAL